MSDPRHSEQSRNYTGQPVFPDGTHNTAQWFNPRRVCHARRVHLGNVGRNTVYGPGMQTMDIAIVRSFPVTERMHLEAVPLIEKPETTTFDWPSTPISGASRFSKI